ncbi:MAG TPA: MFS transporter [Myxococcales bacterium]|jgi:OPA family glycerol-3-phosphate transporter-like MFS transporter|nr:MFS transporter [Myxococcales bacterium]
MTATAEALATPPTAATPDHSDAYRRRRFWNWFPLGLTYATFYMGRYNFNVFKGRFAETFHFDKAEVGVIATAGFWTYALSVILNGPLADRYGGKRAILVGAVGAAVFNLAIGAMFLTGWQTRLILSMSLLYSCNCYFQSFGALSVVKVNTPWFHVRERGFFGGVFGIMISLGYTLALTVGGFLLARFPFWVVFAVPSAALLVMAAVDYFVVRDTPGSAGHSDFDTGDASSGDETPVDLKYVFSKVFTNPIMLTLAAAEFCTGFVRQGLLLYYTEFLGEVHGVKLGSSLFSLASTGITVGGIAGGLLCGWMSDRLFQSRRAPVALLFYVGQALSLLALGLTRDPRLASALVGFSCVFIFGVHGMLSGTASADFGGKKAAATAAGMLDGVQYVASGFTGFGLGWLLKNHGWQVWTPSIIPFSILGALVISRLWNARPRPAAH